MRSRRRCASRSAIHQAETRSAFSIGTHEAIIGNRRTAESPTPIAAAGRDAPAAIAPTRMSWLGSAQTAAVMNIDWPRVRPDSRQSTPKPAIEMRRIAAGTETTPRMPRSAQTQAGGTGSSMPAG